MVNGIWWYWHPVHMADIIEILKRDISCTGRMGERLAPYQQRNRPFEPTVRVHQSSDYTAEPLPEKEDFDGNKLPYTSFS